MRIENQNGVTLLEALLVIVISLSIVLLGVRQYQAYKIQQEYAVLKFNADMLLQAMKQYYQANCGKNGTLYRNSSDELDPAAFDVDDVDKYISYSWPKINTVQAEGDTSTVYTAYFLPTLASRYQYACFYFPNGTDTLDCTDEKLIIDNEDKKNILLWKSQVAIEVRDPDNATYYTHMVGADCATNANPSEPIDCETDGVKMGESATYFIWQKLPSFSSGTMSSPLWQTNYRTKEFNFQYTHDPMYEMYRNAYASDPNYEYEYYLCGG